MNGIENIVKRIEGDGQAKAGEILAAAKAQTIEIQGDFAHKAQAASAEILAAARAEAAQKAERAQGAAALEGRKLLLAAKQDMVNEAFSAALHELKTMPQEEYVSFLAKLLAEAATGSEEVVMNQADRAKVGTEVVAKANQALGAKGKLKLSAETRDMAGGFILASGKVEVNCTLEALIAQTRDRLAGEVAATLFPQ